MSQLVGCLCATLSTAVHCWEEPICLTTLEGHRQPGPLPEGLPPPLPPGHSPTSTQGWTTSTTKGLTGMGPPGRPDPVWPRPYANLTFLIFQHYKPKDRISTGKYLLKAFSFIIYRF